MKILGTFLATYIVALSLILTIHFHLSSDYKEKIRITESEISGLSYLKVLYKLSINVATLNNKSTQGLHSKEIQAKVLLNIDNLLKFQQKNKIYINPKFNAKLEKLKKFNMTVQEYYHFLELIGLENYRIGDISKLLFERDRKTYFLSSLATHYMPEYLISILINHNIIQELKGHISPSKESTFTEQAKLISLSCEEIYAIIKRISHYDDSKQLLIYMNRINEGVNLLSKQVKVSSVFNGDPKSIQKYLKISEEILTHSYLLNDTYMKIIANNLHSRLIKIKKNIIYLNFVLALIVLLISALFLYAYKLYRSRETQYQNLILEQQKTQNALEFRSQFLSNMSHEIRTPLNSIVGLITVILKTELTQKQLSILNKINSAGDLLLGVINDILDIAKIESGKLQIENHDFNLKKSITAIKDMFIIRAQEKDINLVVKYKNITNFQLNGDSLRVSQILINFLNNAIKFTNRGEISLLIEGNDLNMITFSVKDTGIGIKEEHINSLFEEFTQVSMDTTRKYGGTGLGLAISKNLVEMMGGEITVTSEYGKGTIFSFTIALPPSKNEHIDELQLHELTYLEEEVNKLKDITILVAEDNKMNQTLLSMLLEDSELTLEFADDGEIALSMFKQKKYDLILMDIQMPNMNGYEATKLIREFNTSIPILALSANVMEENIEKSLNAGMNYHLAKPIEIQKLYTQLLRFLK